MSAIVPVPKTPIAIRVATAADLPFIDALQKRNTKMVGWMPARQLQEKIRAGHVLVATGDGGGALGYVIGQDRYFKRDDCGIIYQLNVEAGERRKLIGATLIRAVFDRAAYGCRLFCLWCAQDIEANHFWESIGFIPLAFRAGSRQKQRVHIFWQRRIREGDTTTPYWFPAQSGGGSLREDRLVLPIPPGRNWRDEMPLILPREKPKLDDARGNAHAAAATKVVSSPSEPKQLRGWRFAPPAAVEDVKPKAKPAPREKLKNDPQHVAAARELRDRYLEEVNADPQCLIGTAKYEVCRIVGAADGGRMPLPASGANAAPLLGTVAA